jgi:hypothetical protein
MVLVFEGTTPEFAWWDKKVAKNICHAGNKAKNAAPYLAEACLKPYHCTSLLDM